MKKNNTEGNFFKNIFQVNKHFYSFVVPIFTIATSLRVANESEGASTNLRQSVINTTNFVFEFVVAIITFIVIYGVILYFISLRNKKYLSIAEKIIISSLVGIFVIGFAYAIIIIVTNIIIF